MIIAALFTTANTWKRPVSIGGWVDKQDVKFYIIYICNYTYTYVHIHTMEYHSSIKKKEGNPALCDNMDGLKGIMPREISQTEKDKNTVWSLLHGV